MAANTSGVAPSVKISHTAPGSGVGGAVAPKAALRLAISGPRRVTAGRSARYRITLSRSYRRDLRTVPARNVLVVNGRGDRRRVPLLLPGRARTRTVLLRVPPGAQGRFCVTHTARSATAEGATARHCAPVAG